MFRFGSSLLVLWCAAPALAGWTALPVSEESVNTQAVWEVMQAAKERWEVTQGSDFVVTNSVSIQTGFESTVVTNTIGSTSVVGTNWVPVFSTAVVTNQVPVFPSREFLDQIATHVQTMLSSFADHSSTTNDFAHGFETNRALFQKPVTWIPNWTWSSMVKKVGGEFYDYSTNWIQVDPLVDHDLVMGQMSWSADSNDWLVSEYSQMAVQHSPNLVWRYVVRPATVYPVIVYSPGGTGALSTVSVKVEGHALDSNYMPHVAWPPPPTTSEVVSVSQGTNMMSVPFYSVTDLSTSATGVNDGDTIHVAWHASFETLRQDRFELSRYSRASQLNLLYHVLNNLRVTHRGGGQRVGTYFINDQDTRDWTESSTNFVCESLGDDVLEESDPSNAWENAWTDFETDYASGFTNSFGPNAPISVHSLVYGYNLDIDCETVGNRTHVTGGSWKTKDVDSGVPHSADCDGAWLIAVETNDLSPGLREDLPAVVGRIEGVTAYVSSNSWRMLTGDYQDYTNSSLGNHPPVSSFYGGQDTTPTNWIKFASDVSASVSPYSNAVVASTLYNQWGDLPTPYQDVAEHDGGSLWAAVTPFGAGARYSTEITEKGALGLHTVTTWDFEYYDEAGESAE